MMADQQIRDHANRLVATIRAISGGRLEIRDAKNRLLGAYDPQSNQTRDANNRLVATGNALTSLIKPFQ